MKIRMQYAPRRLKNGLFRFFERHPILATGWKDTKVTSKYMPHQGKQEMTRRLKQNG